MYYIGLDIHKKFTQACVLDANGRLVCNDRIRTDVHDIGHWFERMETRTNDELAVALEATGFYFWIYDTIVARGHDAKVVHPVKVKPLMRARSKNDKNDAYMLAELLRSRCLEGIYVPSSDVRAMRELTRHRESLVRKKGDLKREVLAHLLQKGMKVPDDLRTNFSQKHISWMRSVDDFILHEKLDVLELLMTKIRNIESKLDELYGEDEDVRLIRTIPGIGLVTASVIKAEVGDVTRFSSAETLAAYVGLTPLTYQSGEKEWGGHTRNGNSRIKHVLIEAMLFHLHHCPDSRISRYDRRKREAIGRQKAVVATARKLMEAIYFMLVRRQEFQAH